MDAHEIARQAGVLPDRFATRLPAEVLDGLRLMAEGGEYGELTLELAATLARNRTPVTTAEQRELHDLLAAMNLPVSPADALTARG